jgi:hypothetical protein
MNTIVEAVTITCSSSLPRRTLLISDTGFFQALSKIEASVSDSIVSIFSTTIEGATSSTLAGIPLPDRTSSSVVALSLEVLCLTCKHIVYGFLVPSSSSVVNDR